MKRTLFTLAVLALASGPVFSASAPHNVLTSQEKSAGWQLLFDGKSLAGWKASEDKGAFTVEDGCIVTFSDVAKAKAAGLVQAFRDYLEQHQTQIDALQILYSRPFKQRLTEAMLKELEKKLRDTRSTWTEDRLWDAYAVTVPGKVRGRSQAGRFADLVALVRFALEQQPVLAPFADSVSERFHEWLMDKAKAGAVFTPEQMAWLGLIRDHIATSLSIEPEDFEYTPFGERGGLGKAHQLFGEQLPKLLEELNDALAA